MQTRAVASVFIASRFRRPRRAGLGMQAPISWNRSIRTWGSGGRRAHHGKVNNPPCCYELCGWHALLPPLKGFSSLFWTLPHRLGRDGRSEAQLHHFPSQEAQFQRPCPSGGVPPRSISCPTERAAVGLGCSLRACSSPRSTKRLRILPTGSAHVQHSRNGSMVYPTSERRGPVALLPWRMPCRAGVWCSRTTFLSGKSTYTSPLPCLDVLLLRPPPRLDS